MKQVVCAVFDQAAGVYGRPIFVVAVGQATRSFTDEVNRSAADNAMNQHPGDFSLFQLGEYDDVTGAIESLRQPQLVVRGSDVIQQQYSREAVSLLRE